MFPALILVILTGFPVALTMMALAVRSTDHLLESLRRGDV